MISFLERYMDPEIAGWAAAVLGVLVALLVIYVLFKLFGGARERRRRAQNARLSIVDVEEVDGRRRLVLLRRDKVEHLVMIGGPTDIVIEAGIGSEPPANRTMSPRTEPAVRNTNPPSPATGAPSHPPTRPEPAVVAPKPVPEPLETKPSLQIVPSDAPVDQSAPAVVAPARTAAPSPEKPSAPSPSKRVEPTVAVPPTDERRKAELEGEIKDLLAQMGRGPDARPLDPGTKI